MSGPANPELAARLSREIVEFTDSPVESKNVHENLWYLLKLLKQGGGMEATHERYYVESRFIQHLPCYPKLLSYLNDKPYTAEEIIMLEVKHRLST
jgi:hypothetical protein